MKVIQLPEESDIRLDDIQALESSRAWLHVRWRAEQIIQDELKKFRFGNPNEKEVAVGCAFMRGIDRAMKLPDELKRIAKEQRGKG